MIAEKDIIKAKKNMSEIAQSLSLNGGSGTDYINNHILIRKI